MEQKSKYNYHDKVIYYFRKFMRDIVFLFKATINSCDMYSILNQPPPQNGSKLKEKKSAKKEENNVIQKKN